jgi:hypothetical protein
MKHAAPFLLLGMLVLSAGCSNDPTEGYSVAPLYRGGIRSVSVPIWTVGKDVYRRELEFRLTEAIQKQIALDTPYKVTSRARADTEITGTIDLIIQQPLSINPDTGVPREMSVTMVVSFKWTDLRDGKVILERSNFRVSATYLPSEPFSEDFFWGSEDLINRLAARVVEQMEIPFEG